MEDCIGGPDVLLTREHRPIVRTLLALVVVVSFGTAMAADVTVVPLVDPADPVHITNGRVDLADPTHPALVVDLENHTTETLSTAQVWLSMSKFFTKSEMVKNGDRVAWTCGRVAHADIDGQPQVIPAGGRVSIRMAVVNTCRIDPRHGHFFVHVQRVTTDARFSHAFWTREPADVARLLTAAIPHE